MDIKDAELSFLMECGYLCREAGRFDDARDIFTGVNALKPDSEIPTVAIGSVYFAEDRFEEAAECYRNALSQTPDSPFALVHLGEACLFMNREGEAAEHLRKAVEVDPKGDSGQLARMLLKLPGELQQAGLKEGIETE